MLTFWAGCVTLAMEELMTKKEFIDLHGEEAWYKLVLPRQEGREPAHIRNNANTIVHQDVIEPILQLLGFEIYSLKDAREKIDIMRRRIFNLNR